MLYNENNISDEVLKSSVSVLDMEGYKIQQENPSKEDKFFHKGKDSYIPMGSQFMKIILGNFINQEDTRAIFPNIFSEDVLKFADIKHNNNLTGKELDDIYNKIYYKYSDSLKQSLKEEIGLKDIPFNNLNIEEQNNIIRNLYDIIRTEIKDDGKGFNLKKSSSKGIGIQNMYDRTNEIGAELSINSKIGLGTTITLEIPYKS